MAYIDSYNNLVQVLEEEVTVYRHFLDLVRHEYDILKESKIEALVENNQAKDAMIAKLKSLERIREKRARELASAIHFKAEPLLLLELAGKLEFAHGDRLRSIHATLDLLIKRVRENNQKNEILVQSALSNIKGALENLKTSLQIKPTYKNEGHMQEAAVPSGKFVSKEV